MSMRERESWLVERIEPSSEEGTSPEETRARRESAWREQARIVDQLVDRLGRPVDKGIKEAVTALRVLGFPTDGSCEGHLDHGTSFPWIDVSVPAPEGYREELEKLTVWESKPPEWRKNHGDFLDGFREKTKVWRLENIREQRRVFGLLAGFYRDRRTPYEDQLAIEVMGGGGSFRLQNLGATVEQALSPAEREKALERHQREMEEFTNFLIRRFFDQGA